MSIKCDVLVVGGGPAGCSVARTTAKKGLKTILIEKDKKIGSPVQCAEAIGSYLFPYMPFKIPKNQLKWKTNGIYFWADNIAIKKEGGKWAGFSISRKDWDKWLASLAIKEGVEIFTGTNLVSFEFGRKFEVKKAIAEKEKKKIIIEPEYVIGADGVNSKVLDILDVKIKDTEGHVLSYEMKNLKLKYPRFEQLFFGEFAPRAYAYIFPLSKKTANIGVGTVKKNVNLEDFYNNFVNISFVKKQISKGEISIEKSGDAPIRNQSDKLVYGNVFLVGDAANQNIKPFIEGNIPAIICGNKLGEFIYEVSKGKEKPQKYKELINKQFNLIIESQPYGDLVYGEVFADTKIFNLILLGLMSEIISPEEVEIERFVNKGYDFLRNYILKNGGFIEK